MRILEGLLNILKVIISAELINGQQAALIILNQLGDKGLGICAAFYEACESNAGADEQTGHVKMSLAACHADHNCQTVIGHRLQHGLDKSGNTGSFQRELYTAAVGDTADLSSHVFTFSAVDNVGSAALLSKLKAGGYYVNTNDGAAACQLGSHDCADTYGAAAEDCDSVARIGLHAEKNSTCTGLHTAAEGAERLQINFGVYLYSGTLGNDAVIGKSTLTEESADSSAFIIGNALAAVAVNAEEEQRNALIAGVGLSVLAVIAVTAGGERQNNVVAGLEGGYAFADFFNDTYALMSENDGKLSGSLQIKHGRVSVANTAGNQLYHYFAYTGLSQFQFLNSKLTRLADGCSLDLHIKFLRYYNSYYGYIIAQIGGRCKWENRVYSAQLYNITKY